MIILTDLQAALSSLSHSSLCYTACILVTCLNLTLVGFAHSNKYYFWGEKPGSGDRVQVDMMLCFFLTGKTRSDENQS